MTSASESKYYGCGINCLISQITSKSFRKEFENRCGRGTENRVRILLTRFFIYLHTRNARTKAGHSRQRPGTKFRDCDCFGTPTHLPSPRHPVTPSPRRPAASLTTRNREQAPWIHPFAQPGRTTGFQGPVSSTGAVFLLSLQAGQSIPKPTRK